MFFKLCIYSNSALQSTNKKERRSPRQDQPFFSAFWDWGQRSSSVNCSSELQQQNCGWIRETTEFIFIYTPFFKKNALNSWMSILRNKVIFFMTVNISAKPEEKNISCNYPDKHSKLCLVNAFCRTVFGENEIPCIFPTLWKNWVSWMFLVTQQHKGVSSHNTLLLK